MIYTVKYEKHALKELVKLPSSAVKQILLKIDSLAINPYQSGVKKLKGFDHVFRAKAGNYRILYEVDGEQVLIMIVAIGDRKDIYKR